MVLPGRIFRNCESRLYWHYLDTFFPFEITRAAFIGNTWTHSLNLRLQELPLLVLTGHIFHICHCKSCLYLPGHIFPIWDRIKTAFNGITWTNFSHLQSQELPLLVLPWHIFHICDRSCISCLWERTRILDSSPPTLRPSGNERKEQKEQKEQKEWWM